MGLLKFGAKMLSNTTGSRAGMAALSLGVFGLGAASVAAPAARDAFLDVTTGTPDADKYFIGDKLSARYLTGAAVGGPLGLGFKVTDPKNLIKMDLTGIGPNGNPIANTGTGVVGGSILGGTLGALRGYAKGGLGSAIKGGLLGATGGGILGGAVAGTTTAAANPATGGMMGSSLGGLTGSLIGGLAGARRGLPGAAKGFLMGGLIGGTTGGILGSAAPLIATAHHVNSNKTFYSQSPYARTSSVGYQGSVSTDLPASAVRNIVPNPSFR